MRADARHIKPRVPARGMITATVKMGLLTPTHIIKITLPLPEIHLLGDSRACQTDNTNFTKFKKKKTEL